MRIVRPSIALATLAIAVAPAAALGGTNSAGTGMVDASFGVGGEARVGHGFVHAIAPSSRGGYLVLTETGVRRLDAVGRIDSGFGTNGVAPASTGMTRPALAGLADGRFYVAAVRKPGPAITIRRYQADGSIDTSYGDGGAVRVTSAGACGAVKDRSDVELHPLRSGGLVLRVSIPYQTHDKYLGTVPTYHLQRIRPDGSVDESLKVGCTGPLGQMTFAVGPDDGVVVQQNSTISSYSASGVMLWSHSASNGAPVGMVVGIQPSGHTIVTGSGGLDRIDTTGLREVGWSKAGSSSGFGALRTTAQRVDAAGGLVSAGSFSGGILVSRLSPDGTIDASFGYGGEIVACSTTPGSTASEARGLVIGEDRIGVLASVRGSQVSEGASILQLAGPRRESEKPVPTLFQVSDAGWSPPFPHLGTAYGGRAMAVSASACGAARVSTTAVTWQGVSYAQDELGRLPLLAQGRGPLVVTATDINGVVGVREWDLVVDGRGPSVRLTRIAPRTFTFTVTDGIAGPRRHAALRLPRSGCHTKSLVFRDRAGNGTTLDVRAQGTNLAILRRYATPYSTYGDTDWRPCRTRR